MSSDSKNHVGFLVDKISELGHTNMPPNKHGSKLHRKLFMHKASTTSYVTNPALPINEIDNRLKSIPIDGNRYQLID